LSVQCATAGVEGVAGFAQRVSGLVAGFDGAGVSLADDPAACLDLLDRFMDVSDGRSRQARAHPVAAALTLAAAAVLAGMRSFTAIAGWVLDVAPGMLERLYTRCGMPVSMPSRSTLWRVLTGADARSVDQAVGAWLAARYAATVSDADEDLVREALMLDGKTLRGARDAEGHQVPPPCSPSTHHHALVLTQVEVGAKTNEIPKFSEVLDELDITGWTVTVDALHTQRAHATYLHGRGADFVFMVKDSQPNLFAALNSLDWPSVPIGHYSKDIGHGRVETRTIQVLPAPADLPFPHVNQVFLVERGVTDVHGKSLSNVAIFGVTSHTTQTAAPARLAQFVRGQWGIESLHWIRDAIYREDQSTAHTGSGPRVMAAFRNLAVGALRLFGRNDIAEATRWANRDMTRAFTVLGLDKRS
jgi:predicted transposase YbfD/YdcC